MTTYSSAELMIINAARLLRDGDVVFVGVGQPNLASAEKGEALFQTFATGVTQFLEQVMAWDGHSWDKP